MAKVHDERWASGPGMGAGRGPGPQPDRIVGIDLERIAWLMDRAFKIPGTKVSVGLDALLGLLPVGGDVVTGLVQAGLVLVALGRYKVPTHVAARMMANVLLDTSVGAIPLLGDLFDLAFKANTRNLRLLEPYRLRAQQQQQPQHADPTGFADATRPGPSRSFLDPPTLTIGPGGTPWRIIVPIAAALILMLALVAVGFVTIIRWIVRG